ncbi:MAG: 2,3-butanediol dehydrogenase [Anaerolineales bacterium]
MKAAIWYGRRDLRVEEVPEPPFPPPGQVKVEVAWCGICGSDLHEYVAGPLKIPVDTPHPLTGVQAPVILGHELSGRVVETGEGITRFKMGDRVALATLIGCQECRWCRSGLMGLCKNLAFLGKSWSGGGFSRYVNVPEYLCYPLPDELPDEIGAMVEPFAAAVRAVSQGELQQGETVAIVGAGPIGLLNVQAARILGAGKVIVLEPAGNRQELAFRCGADQVLDPFQDDPEEAFLELTDGQKADLVIECVGGTDTVLIAGRLARTRGRVVIMGVFEQPSRLDFTDLVFGEKTLIGSMGGYGKFSQAIEMMASGEFIGQPLITGRIPLTEIVSKGFEALLNDRESHIKVLVASE